MYEVTVIMINDTPIGVLAPGVPESEATKVVKKYIEKYFPHLDEYETEDLLYIHTETVYFYTEIEISEMNKERSKK